MCRKIRCDEESWKFLRTKQGLNALYIYCKTRCDEKSKIFLYYSVYVLKDHARNENRLRALWQTATTNLPTSMSRCRTRNMSEFLFLSPPARAINQDETPTRRKPLLLAHSTLPLKTGRKERRHGDRPHTAHRPAAHVVVRRLRLRLRGHSKEAHEQVYFVRARSWAKRRERRGGPSGLFGSNQVSAS